MITQEQIPLVINRPLHAAGGDRMGEVKHVFLDATGQPEWLCVKTGLFGLTERFVPVRDADLVQDHVEVPYDKETIKDAPHVGADAHGRLPVADEQELYRYYNLVAKENLPVERVRLTQNPSTGRKTAEPREERIEAGGNLRARRERGHRPAAPGAECGREISGAAELRPRRAR
ncbi:PRC-barrel domain-containing protein [Planobispora longispora]|uniref:PRC-barrel domain-containing protein n=1 Tax=Planobispora longispora TaxID=28887 RepID=A0A8J3RR24_9ACTN|nr:PRC-barrel domain-containing protein [Planobispora longispora]GIH79634.1 hypothetical protein Plo01_60630 [Planobispora longispora]